MHMHTHTQTHTYTHTHTCMHTHSHVHNSCRQDGHTDPVRHWSAWELIRHYEPVLKNSPEGETITQSRHNLLTYLLNYSLVYTLKY